MSMLEASLPNQQFESGADPSSPPVPPRKPKRFQCHHCQRLFARLEHLQRHERTHTQEKPFACDQCDQRFTRSDLLIRHGRLSHSTDRRVSSQSEKGNGHGARGRRKRTAHAASMNEEPPAKSPLMNFEHSDTFNSTEPSDLLYGHHTMPLTTLSMAAEQAALQGIIPSPQDSQAILATTKNAHISIPEPESIDHPPTETNYGLDFEYSLDSLAAFLDNGPLESHHFPSFVNAEQPMPFFSPESGINGAEIRQGIHQEEHAPAPTALEESGSFSRFGSRLPSLQPEESPTLRDQDPSSARKPLSDISVEDRQLILSKLSEFSGVVLSGFRLPSRLALSRYLAGYVNGFHEHMPCLHVQTMSVQKCSIELLLAMAAVGAQYCFEGEKGVELFHASQGIAMQRIRRRDTRFAEHTENYQPRFLNSPQNTEGIDPHSSWAGHATHTLSPSLPGPLGLPPDQGTSEDLIQTAQALFLLMAMATWAKHKEILRQALAIQSILATLVREDGLKMTPLVGDDISWEKWIRHESVKRTKFIVFCFFNLHCIVYNIPSLILSSELDLPLPCSAAEFKAPSMMRWREARKKNDLPEINFQTAFQRLFERSGPSDMERYSYTSSLGNYVLIHALIQHIFFVRQIARRRTSSLNLTNQDLDSEEISALEQALRNWQMGWKQNPESSLDPLDPNGPIAFNSTALLRLAYIRLNNIFAGPGHHALATRDPVQIAHSFREISATRIGRTRKLVRAVLHSAHALSIPIKIGIRLVARTQTFTWSIQHSLCSLECAFLLCKWLEALALPNPQPEATDDEKRICWLVKTMLDETEYGVYCEDEQALQSPTMLRQLSAGVLRVWAQIFKGAQTWAIVDIIGTALNTYADMLDNSHS